MNIVFFFSSRALMVDKHKILRFSACWDMRFDHQVASAASEVAHGEFQGFYSLNRPLMTTVKRRWTIEKTSSSDTEHLLVWRRITDRLSQNTSARMRRVGDRRAEPPLVIKASLPPKRWLIQEKNGWWVFQKQMTDVKLSDFLLHWPFDPPAFSENLPSEAAMLLP